MIHETLHALTPMAAGGSEGIFDLAANLSGKTITTIRIFASVACTAAFLWLSNKGRWTFPAIVGSLMTCAFVLWGVFNITDVQKRVDHDITNSMAPMTTSTTVPPAAPGGSA